MKVKAHHTCILDTDKSVVFCEQTAVYPRYPQHNHVDIWWDSLDGACPPNRYCTLNMERTECKNAWLERPDNWSGK